MKIMSASFLLAGVGLTGCRRPVSNILPFSKQPEGYLHGVPQYYATAMPTRGGAIPLVVKSNDGRPTKVEGNALHPGQQRLDGPLCAGLGAGPVRPGPGDAFQAGRQGGDAGGGAGLSERAVAAVRRTSKARACAS